MAGYTRQSIADIVNGLDITAPPLTAEFNQIDSAFHATTGHAHDGSTGNGPKINLATSVQGILPSANGGVGGSNKIDATVPPATTNDNLQGYAPGSTWINVTTGRVYRCVGNATNAAVWREEVQVLNGNQITPAATNTVDLGTSAVKFKDIHLSGSVVGNVTGNITASTGTSTFNDVTINGSLNMASGTSATVTGLSTPVNATDAATKAYVDSVAGASSSAAASAAAAEAAAASINLSNIAITGGSITGITDLAIADGGTGASTAVNARTNLGLGNLATQAASAVAVTGGTIDGTTVGATTAAAGTFTDLTSVNSRLTSTPDVTLAGTTHALQIGPSTSPNLAFDTADIQGRNNGAASNLNLNALGGNISLGSVSTTVSIPGIVSASPGSAAVPSLAFAGDTNTGFWSPAADTLAFSTNGLERMRLLPSGNLTVDGTTLTVDAVNNRVGVGTETPMTALDVVGTVNATGMSLSGTAITSTAAELNILDGVTSTAAELNVLAGITATTAELNILDGVTSTAAELNILDGVTATAAELNVLDGITANVRQLNSSSEDVNSENRIINGDMGIWQRGTSGNINGYPVADRWILSANLGTITQSRQSFAVGDMLGANCPTYFLRQSVAPTAGVTHFASISQKVEGVRSYAGQTITVLGWARRFSGAGNMTVEASQYFGFYGTPSATVSGINPTTVALSASWEPFAVVLNIPSIVGKTIGSQGTYFDDSFNINFWTSAGSNYNARTNSLGIQTIAVDLWGIHIRVGTWTAADAALYRPRDPATELALCQRYYELFNATAGSNGAYINGYSFAVTKRAVPTLTVVAGFLASSTWQADQNRFMQNGNSTGVSGISFGCDAEL